MRVFRSEIAGLTVGVFGSVVVLSHYESESGEKVPMRSL